MLGIISDVFIGTPTITLAGNIARARLAMGFDPTTNYLFMAKTKNDHNNKNKRSGESWAPVRGIKDGLFNKTLMGLYFG